MRAQSPSMIGGLSFERLSFGHLPISILGVRHVPSWNADNLGIGAFPCPSSFPLQRSFHLTTVGSYHASVFWCPAQQGLAGESDSICNQKHCETAALHGGRITIGSKCMLEFAMEMLSLQRQLMIASF